jgi:hypothetical protein
MKGRIIKKNYDNSTLHLEGTGSFFFSFFNNSALHLEGTDSSPIEFPFPISNSIPTKKT